MGTLTIIRGLPGSGKSTMAAALSKKSGAMVIEPDALLVEDGDYLYTPLRYRYAVYGCKLLLERVGGGGMRADAIYTDVLPTVEEVDAVVWAYRGRHNEGSLKVISLATTADDALLANRHNVPEEDVRRMERDWEPYPGEVVM